MNFINYIRNSWSLTCSLVQIVIRDKRILVFSLALLFFRILFYIACLLILYFKLPRTGSSVGMFVQAFIETFNYWYYWLFFIGGVFYLNFVAILFNLATISYVGKILSGESYSFLDALKLAWSRSSYIAEWILFYPFFGWIIGFFALLIEQVDRVIVHFFGSSWQPLRWMSLPSLVLEQGSLIDRWKCSGRYLKKKWGLPVGRFLSIGAVLSACIIPFFILALWTEFSSITVHLKHYIFGVIVVYFGILHVSSAMLSNIFQAVMYLYVFHDKVPEGFQKEVLQRTALV